MQSGQMIQYTDIAADLEKSDTSTNMFEMEKPPADRWRRFPAFIFTAPHYGLRYGLLRLAEISNDLEVVRPL
jgi:hypothetical protein